MEYSELEKKKSELDRLEGEVKAMNERGDTFGVQDKLSRIETLIHELNALTREYERELHR